jgi:hypothetical protein
LRDCAAIINAFKSKFLHEFDALNCQTFLTAFREEQDQAGCAKLTAHAAVMVADLLEEFGREAEMDFDTYSSQNLLQELPGEGFLDHDHLLRRP